MTPIETYDYHYEDYPMDTVEQLQALVDQILEEVPMPTVVNLHLPPVTYQGELAIEGRPINLYGSQEGDQRTTYYNKFGQESRQPVRLPSISCLSYNKRSNWLTFTSLGLHVRRKDCQPSSYCSVRFKQVEPTGMLGSSCHAID